MNNESSTLRFFLSSVKLIELTHDFANNGDLVVMEGHIHVPFDIARVFVVKAPAGAIRGQHAHKACTQFLTCPIGKVEVLCDDGVNTAIYVLDKPNHGLLLPPGIWAQQVYVEPHSVLTVLCDRPYEAEDYIRDYSEFKAYRKIDADNGIGSENGK